MNCICCGNNTNTISYEDAFLGNKLEKCTKCAHIQLKIVPSSKQVSEYYSKAYVENRNSFVNEEYFKIMDKRAKAQFEIIKDYVEVKNKSFCDIGCGFGYFIKNVQSGARSIYGLEYDDFAIGYCHKSGLNVKKITKEDDISTIENSDIVVLSHVLEHLYQINETLEILKNKAEYIFIEIPSYKENVKEQFLDQEGHINFFNPGSLSKILMQHDLQIIHLASYGPAINTFWRNDLLSRYLRVLYRRFYKDYFFNMYNKVNKNGIWIRAIVKTRR